MFCPEPDLEEELIQKKTNTDKFPVVIYRANLHLHPLFLSLIQKPIAFSEFLGFQLGRVQGPTICLDVDLSHHRSFGPGDGDALWRHLSQTVPPGVMLSILSSEK